MTTPRLRRVCDWRPVQTQPQFAEQAEPQLQSKMQARVRCGGGCDACWR